MWSKTLSAILTTAILFASASAYAGDIIVPRDELVSILSGYHDTPGEDYWMKLDPGQTRETLKSITDDPTVFTPVRARALIALTYFGNDEVSGLLSNKLRTETLPYLRSAACEALSRLKGEESLPELKDALNDQNVMVRLTAIRSLRRLGTDNAKQTLQNRLATETNTTAKSVIQRALTQMEQ